ncbi:unnamed protein product [Penicillium pancosmium]
MPTTGSIDDDTTPLISDRRGDEDIQQPYSTFLSKTPLLSETEQGPLSSDESSVDDASTKSAGGGCMGSVTSIIVILLLGEFISNADSTIVMATAGPISSEFNKLQDASWLATAFALGVGSVQLIVCGNWRAIMSTRPELTVATSMANSASYTAANRFC